ncbi:MAG: histidine kinase [Chitinophagaceae bacterium]|nr:histidine kinase [Chitinophagaceae bacterium]
MKLIKPPAYEFYGFLISMPFITLWVHYILYGNRVFTDPQLWFFSFPLLFILAVVSWYCHFRYHYFVASRLPGLKNSYKRIFFKLLVYPLVMAPSVIAIHGIYAGFNLFGYSYNPESLKLWLLQGIFVNLIFETLWEVIYMIDQYKESLMEKELLELMNTEQEFENLKSQVNPHFLFNCFNTLSGLISEDRQMADKFLNELSKVYRYVLNTNQNDLTTLHNETRFIHSYMVLLQTRYGQGLHVDIRIDEAYYNYSIPTMSLQLLVENAVKHNIVSKKEPLCIEIYTTSENELIVCNNLQPKQTKENSTGIGLKNIKSKYTLLKQPGFEGGTIAGRFVVNLPLIKNKQ